MPAKWQCGIFSGYDPVDFLAPYVLLALMWFYNRRRTYFMNECKTHIGKCRLTIHATFCFHLADNMLNHFLFILVQMQRILHQLITLDQLAGCKACRYLVLMGMVLNQVHN